MCGIVAILSPCEQVSREVLSSGRRILKHRGPDGEGLWLSSDQKVGLAHTRLAVVGLDDGVQPLGSEDGKIQAVVNGEFYDFERIRRELQAHGHNFKTQSDSEILVHLYEEYGTDCLQFLRGEFAFVLWDERKRRLFAARDRFGIKPLFYTCLNDRLYFASEAKALFAMGVPAKWDLESFFHAASTQYVLPQRSLFEGVNQLAPGHYMVADYAGSKCSLNLSSYWDIDYRQEEIADSCDLGALAEVSSGLERELIDEFYERFGEAVRLRLRSDVPLCFHLSGGLDSSAVVAMAKKYSAQNLKCFTVSFGEAAYDELAIAQEMARHAHVDLETVFVSQSDLVEHLSDAVYFSEGLAVNGHLSAKYLLNKQIRSRGFKVALTGEGSDELVAGYPHLRSDLYTLTGQASKLELLNAENKASAGIMLGGGNSLSLKAVEERLSFVPSFLVAKGALGYRINGLLSYDYKNKFSQTDCYAQLLDNLNVGKQIKGRHPVNQSLYIWSKTALANYILKTLGDGAEMAHSVEGRLPFLDHHLFEFASSLPLGLKIKGSVEKYILREAMQGLVTDTVHKRQKHPFMAPPLSNFSDARSNSLLQDTLRSKACQSLPFFDQSKVCQLLDKLPAMAEDERRAMDPVFMTILSAACLQNRFGL